MRPEENPAPHDKNPANWFEYLLTAREALEKQGVPLMTPEEAEAHIAELRADRICDW